MLAALGLAHAALRGQVAAGERAGRVGRPHVLLPVPLPVGVSAALCKTSVDAESAVSHAAGVERGSRR